MAKKYLIQASPVAFMNKGWGNGYVILDKNDFLFKFNLMDLEWMGIIDTGVHGGITYDSIITEETLKFFPLLDESDIGLHMIGFDTSHSYSTPLHDCAYVDRETRKLLDYINHSNSILYKVRFYLQHGGKELPCPR